MAKTKKSSLAVTDIVWRKKKGQWYKVWLKDKKEVKKEKFDQPYSD